MLHPALEPLSDALWTEAVQAVATAREDDPRLAGVPYAPDRAAYQVEMAKGSLRLFTLRDDTRALCGLAVFHLLRDRKFGGRLRAAVELVHLGDGARPSWSPQRFTQWCHGALTAEGVEIISSGVRRT